MTEEEAIEMLTRHAFAMANKALPCEGCISKESVIEWLKDKDIIKTKNQEENARRELAELPSVTPQPRMGKWNILGDMWECSRCEKLVVGYDGLNYCPNCGAEMESEE